ncbi:HTH domain-containing protein [Bacillus cereus]|uniref:HTH domain-containing protein n=1 Tax=Bacillus cereus TaxID=1396 RepID=UPI002FDBCEE6
MNKNNDLIHNVEHVNGLIKYVSLTEMKSKVKKAKKIERPELQYTKEEAKMRAENLINFLKLVHPGNVGSGYKKPIEIKFLLRGEGVTRNFYKPTMLFNLEDEKTLEVLTEALYATSPFSHCCYYSLYTFDNKKEVRKPTVASNGLPTYEYKAKNTIVDGNTCETWALPIDMDRISREEYKEYRGILLNLGIETIGLSSGFGYQSLILMDRPVQDKTLYQEFTTKIKKIIPAADENINVATQVFRSPYSRNCKEYSDQFKYYKPNDPQPREVTVLDWTVKRYSKEEIFAILDAEIERIHGKSEPESPENAICEASEERTVETSSNNVTVRVSKRSGVITNGKTYQDLYQHLDFEGLPLNIQNILKGTEEGLRNKCVLYLTPFLNKVLGLTQEQALETLLTFNDLCTPAKAEATVKEDYYRFSEAYADYTKGIYDPGMAQAFGKEELDTLIRADFDKIKFDNEVIKKFNKIHHTAIQIYLAMQLSEIELEKETFTKEEIAEAARVSEKTVQRYIKELTKHSIVVNVKGNSRQGIKKGYKINRYGQYLNGFTKLSKSLVKTMLMELQPSEMVVYTYMMHKVGAMDVTLLFTSQTQIALDIGLKQNRISEVTDILKDKKYIKKSTTMGKQNRKKTTYTLRNE